MMSTGLASPKMEAGLRGARTTAGSESSCSLMFTWRPAGTKKSHHIRTEYQTRDHTSAQRLWAGCRSLLTFGRGAPAGNSSAAAGAGAGAAAAVAASAAGAGPPSAFFDLKLNEEKSPAGLSLAPPAHGWQSIAEDQQGKDTREKFHRKGTQACKQKHTREKNGVLRGPKSTAVDREEHMITQQ